MARSIRDENILSIEMDSSNNSYWIRANSLTGSYWNAYMYERADSAEKRWRSVVSLLSDIRLQTRGRQIDSLLARAIADVFEKAVGQTAIPQNPRVGADGITFTYCIYSEKDGLKCGKIWYPERGSKMHRLAMFSGRLFQFVQSANFRQEKSMTEESLIKEARAMLKILGG
jgi:hypothetical protein